MSIRTSIPVRRRQVVPHTRRTYLWFLRKCEMGPKWPWLCRRMGIRDLLHCIHPSVNYIMIMFTFPSNYRYAFIILTTSLLRSTVTQYPALATPIKLILPLC